MLQTAIIAQRTDEGEPDTTEIRQLTEAAGARVVGEVTQTRHADPGTELGSGKVEALGSLVEETGADTVVVDGTLTPQQTVNLEDAVGATVVDRHRVVLDIFATQAHSRRSQLQVELARLRYRLPRVRERADEGMLNRRTEKGTRYYDIEDRIDELERKLSDLPPVDEHLRERRREEGFDLVALAGYTNAGKSTLLRRLADEMSVETETHQDIEQSATTEDRLFKTLQTTRRRATIEGRKTLLTDTVGFLADLPHWLVASFRGTLDAVEAADTVLLVADIAQPVPELRRKLETVRETVPDDHPPVVTVLNKADLLTEHEQTQRVAAVSDLAPEPVVVSALEGELTALKQRLETTLPPLETATLSVPMTDGGMALLSWLHEQTATIEPSYGSEHVQVSFTAKSQIVQQAKHRASRLTDPADSNSTTS